MTQRLHTRRFRLEALTPLFVGSGQPPLSPLTDFVCDEGSILLIHPEKLAGALAAKPGLMDEYVASVRKHTASRSGFDLRRFLEHRVGADPATLAYARVPARGEVGRLPLVRPVTNGGRPYLPGSSLKGALRTALFAEHLRTPQALATRKRLRECARANQWKDLKDMRLEQEVFGRFHTDLLRVLRPADTVPTAADTLEAVEVHTVPLWNRTRREAIPQGRLVIRKGTALTGSLSILAGVARSDAFPFLETADFPALFKPINDFAYRCAEREAYLLDKAAAEDEKAFGDLADFYDGLAQRIKALPDDEVILRLGRGKTFFDQSLGLVLEDPPEGEDPAIVPYLNTLKVGRNVREAARFPKMRSFVVAKGQPVAPLGWVHLAVRG